MKRLLTIFILILSLKMALYGQNEKVKGVQIFKTAINTNWPDLGDHFVIGIYGESNVFFVLSAISRSRKIGESHVFVKKINSVSDAAGCNIVFVTKSKADDLKAVKDITASKNILLITEEVMDSDTSLCDINLKSESTKVNFEINKSKLNKNLSFTDKLMAEAARIY